MGEIESALDLILKNQAGAVQNLSAKATEDTDGEAVPSPAPRPPRSDRISPETAEAIWKAMAQQMDSDADLAGNCVVFTSALSCVTIFCWIVLFKELGVL